MPPTPKTPGASGLRWMREPLLHFLVIGALLSCATAAWQWHTDERRIVLTPEHIAQLANTYALQFGRQPDARTMEALIARDIHDEVLYREGRAMGLDQDDLVVRRRVVQKMQFFTEGLHPPPEPDEAQLVAYFTARPDRYTDPQRVTFSHIFFSAQVGGDMAAQARASQVLATLDHAVPRAPGLGDPFPDAYDYSAQDAGQIQRLFGPTPLAQALRDQRPMQWAGPLRSAYGWHLVRVAARSVPQHASLDQVRDRVRTDYLLDAQAAANKTAFNRMASRYTVERIEATQ